MGATFSFARLRMVLFCAARQRPDLRAFPAVTVEGFRLLSAWARFESRDHLSRAQCTQIPAARRLGQHAQPQCLYAVVEGWSPPFRVSLLREVAWKDRPTCPHCVSAVRETKSVNTRTKQFTFLIGLGGLS